MDVTIPQTAVEETRKKSVRFLVVGTAPRGYLLSQGCHHPLGANAHGPPHHLPPPVDRPRPGRAARDCDRRRWLAGPARDAAARQDAAGSPPQNAAVSPTAPVRLAQGPAAARAG